MGIPASNGSNTNGTFDPVGQDGCETQSRRIPHTTHTGLASDGSAAFGERPQRLPQKRSHKQIGTPQLCRKNSGEGIPRLNQESSDRNKSSTEVGSVEDMLKAPSVLLERRS